MAKKIVKNLKKVLKREKNNLEFIESEIKSEKVEFSNKRLFKLMSKAHKVQSKINTIEDQIKVFTKIRRKQMFISVGSKVKLISTKIGAVVWVDAKNYFNLMGMKVGDTVTMYNSSFLIAGIY